jgi:heptosyltransferase II
LRAREKLLIVGPAWVGDMVMAHALYRLLWEQREEPEIHVLAPEWSRPVLERMPEVARAIALPASHGELAFGERRALGRRLRAERYSQAIVLPRSWKSALTPYFARVPRRTGFRGEWRYGLLNDIRAFDPRVLDQTVKRFAALGRRSPREPLGEPPRPRLAVNSDRQAALIERHALGDSAAVAMMPGAEYGPAKQWPIERFGALARELTDAGVAVWVLGSAKEAALGEALEQMGGSAVRNLCGKTSLADAIDLLAASAAAVSNDSGLMHVAAAVDTHVVAIYGSSSPAFTPPLTEARTIVHLNLDCSPCWQRTCPLGHLRCLRDIDARSVARHVRAVLDARSRGERQ